MRFELARADDEPQLRRLLRETPVQGDLCISFEREPDFHLAGDVEGERSQVLVARSGPGAPPVAMGTRTLRECFVNGQPRRVGYLSQLRVAAQYRGRASLLRRGYDLLHELHADGDADFYLTTIVADNLVARRVLEAGLPRLPVYRYFDELLTFVFPVAAELRGRAPRRVELEVGAAGEADVGAVADCLARYGARHQFAPVWTEGLLRSPRRARGIGVADFRVARRGGRVVGCLACWDQRDFKQTVVRGMSRRTAALRPIANLLAGATGAVRIPAVGESLALGYLSHLAIDDDDPAVFRALLDATRRHAAARGLEFASLGLSVRNALAPAARALLRARRYSSRLYAVYWPDGADAVRALHDRASHVEVATL